VVHNTALNSSGNIPIYDPDNRHRTDDVYWWGEGSFCLPNVSYARTHTTYMRICAQTCVAAVIRNIAGNAD